VPPGGVDLPTLLDRLEAIYGPQAPPPTDEPFELVLWENIAYLADDPTRLAAFRELKARVGTHPAEILAASPETLRGIAQAGILAENTVEKLKAAAQIAHDQDDLGTLRSLPIAQARRLLRRFPGIGEPGADKVLLFARIQAVPSFESNGLRVLTRLGYGEEQSSYAPMYRSALEAASPELPDGFDGLTRAHLLLRRHGQELCRRSAPRCEVCPLAPDCAYRRARAR
jgi:endonuclease-3